jgi:membrane protease YdiL (CAAX protease family)
VSAGAWAMAAALVLLFGSLLFVIASMTRSIRVQRNPKASVWSQFGLGLGLMILFFATWIAHGIAEWQVFTDEQREHGESTEFGDFLGAYAQSTLENWQSEFLQLFAFVVLAALYVHKGSAESKDSDDRMEASLRRIEEHLGTMPAPAPPGDFLPDPEPERQG